MAETRVRIDRRAFGRRRSCIHAMVLIPGRPPAPCMVRNFSASGALLEMNELLEPPFNFNLRVDNTGDLIPCELRHVRSYRIGVGFTGGDVADMLARAFGGRVRKSRRKETVDIAPLVPSARVTGQELRRTVLKQA